MTAGDESKYLAQLEIDIKEEAVEGRLLWLERMMLRTVWHLCMMAGAFFGWVVAINVVGKEDMGTWQFAVVAFVAYAVFLFLAYKWEISASGATGRIKTMSKNFN